MTDEAVKNKIETIRRQMVDEINSDPGSREALQAKYGEVYNTEELASAFEVVSFMAPYVIVRRKSDGAKGSLMVQHRPRFYFSFRKDK